MHKAPTSDVSDAIGRLTAGMNALSNQLTRTRQKVYALEAAARLAQAGGAPRAPVEFRAQFGEDIFLWDLLSGQTEGFFIEVGAFNGYDFSVTYGFECVGWSGLLIEAIPERAEQCRVRRPHSRVVNAALSKRGSTGTADFVVTQDVHGGMLSYLTANPGHVAPLDARGVKRSTVTVPLTTMDDLLKDHSGPIDVAVIDVEGGEVDLLSGFDLHRHRPRVLMIEDNTGGRDPGLARFMATTAYVQVGWVRINAVYVRADLTDLQARAGQMG